MGFSFDADGTLDAPDDFDERFTARAVLGAYEPWWQWANLQAMADAVEAGDLAGVLEAASWETAEVRPATDSRSGLMAIADAAHGRTPPTSGRVLDLTHYDNGDPETLAATLGVLAAEGFTGFIDCDGDEAVRWRWRLHQGECTEHYGIITYPGDPVDDEAVAAVTSQASVQPVTTNDPKES